MFIVHNSNENKVPLKLVEEDSAVRLVTVDVDGCIGWSILDINNDGTITLCEEIPKNNKEGIQVDYDGCIVITDVEY